MSKPAFRPIAPLDNVDDTALGVVADSLGVPTMVRPAATTASKPPPTAPVPIVPARPEKLTVELPGYLLDAIKQKAALERTSIRHLVMLAFKALGLPVAAEDMIADARRTKQKYRKA